MLLPLYNIITCIKFSLSLVLTSAIVIHTCTCMNVLFPRLFVVVYKHVMLILLMDWLPIVAFQYYSNSSTTE